MADKGQYTMHLIDEDTSKLETRQLLLELPVWAWEFLQSRADFHHGGSLEKAAQEMFSVGIESVFRSSTERVDGMPKKDDWN